MGTSDRLLDGSRRLFVAAAAVAVAVIGGAGGAADGAASLDARVPAFRWLHPRPAPNGWKLARLPSGAAAFAYPKTWRPIRTDPGTASVALLAYAGSIRGYLNATPRQGAETLANWPTFRTRHLRDDETTDVRLIAGARELRFRSGRGSCVIDSYRTSRTRYREIACLVAGARTSSVIVGAAPSKTWAREATTIERAIDSFRTG